MSSSNISQTNRFPNANDSLSSELTNSSFKEQKKSYNLRKKYFGKNIQSAIESTQEIHSGWLKARTTFKRWSKVWCQVKPGYLILYTGQEAQKKHRLGVVLLSVCQLIDRPTKKEGFCFKLINPFDCNVWALGSTRAILFPQTSLTLRASDESIGKLWLGAIHRCNLSTNLNGFNNIFNNNDNKMLEEKDCNRIDTSDSDDDDGETTTGQLESILCQDMNSDCNSLLSDNSRFSNSRLQLNGGISSSKQTTISPTKSTVSKPAQNINQSAAIATPSHLKDKGGNSKQLNYNNNNYDMNNRNLIKELSNGLQSNRSNLNEISQSMNVSDENNLNSTKMVAKFSKYNWKELQLEYVKYLCDEGVEEFGTAGAQSEDVHESNKNFLWHIIKQLRPGMDLSKVTLPTFILEPRSFLEKLADYYYHCDILSDAVLIDDPTLRLVNIVKWYLSGFYKKPKGPKKPYNPILGERFRCFWDHTKTRSRTFFIAEQVSHHPPISAFHVSNKKDGYTITCSLLSRSKFGGNSVSAILDGKAKLYLNKRRETYTLTMPYAHCRGILLGSLCLELGGKVEIECAETKCKCELDFKLAPVWANANSYNTLNGKIFFANKVTHTLDGHWDKKINIVDKRTDEKSVLWEVTEDVMKSRLRRYTVSMEDQNERESMKLWSKVTEALNASDQTLATTEKTKLEDMQRQEARDRKGVFIPEHFELETSGSSEWNYKWHDTRGWDESQDIVQFEDNFKIKTLVLNSKTGSSKKVLNVDIDLPLSQVSKFSSKCDFSATDPAGSAGSGRKIADFHNMDSLPETKDTPFRSIESRFDAKNLIIEQAIKQVTERSKKLEEDIANLQRGKKTAALVATAIIVAIIGVFFTYFS